MNRNSSRSAAHAFTLIELLVVIAIISILAAILFPVFATVRETTRQSSTMSSMHTVYLGARLFYEDEGRYPSSLFGYAEVSLQSPPYDPTKALARPAVPGDTGITPMDQATGSFNTNFGGTGRSLNTGYLYREQVKDFNTFINPEAPVTHQQTSAGKGKQAVTTVVTPYTLPTMIDGRVLASQPVVWTGAGSIPSGGGVCSLAGDSDLPADPLYLGVSKVYYTMDSMDIGPQIIVSGPNAGQYNTDASGNIIYELHYSPDWTKERYDPVNQCDEYKDIKGNIYNIPQQLKYKNPPTERTVLTYITDHVAFGGSKNVLILLMSGTARTLDYQRAFNISTSPYTLPLNYH